MSEPWQDAYLRGVREGNPAEVVEVLDCNAADLHRDAHVWDFGSDEKFVCFGSPDAETEGGR